MIKRIVKLEMLPEKKEAFKQSFDTNKHKILGQEGCFHVEMLQCLAPDNIFFTYSLWESEEALDQYRNTELFKQVWAHVKPMFAEKAQAWSTRLADAPWL